MPTYNETLTVTTGGASITGTVTTTGSGGGLVFADRTTGRTFQWYATGDVAYLFDGVSVNLVSIGVNGVVTVGKGVTLSPITTTQRDALTPTDGMTVYNSTLKRFQGYSDGAWRDLDNKSKGAYITKGTGSSLTKNSWTVIPFDTTAWECESGVWTNLTHNAIKIPAATDGGGPAAYMVQVYLAANQQGDAKNYRRQLQIQLSTDNGSSWTGPFMGQSHCADNDDQYSCASFVIPPNWTQFPVLVRARCYAASAGSGTVPINEASLQVYKL